ncbi:MAG TPA: hypothetical protein VFL66_00605 [Gaiellaceae bacterium]|nr:hypothetical protein [Gaiellaceae bacterium]
MRRLLPFLVVLAALAVPATAGAAQLIDRDVTAVSLEVNAQGQALITYKKAGKLRRVLAWGAENAIPPTKSRKQVAFKVDYSGGWGTYHKKIWTSFKNVCHAYSGPPLAWKLTACTAPDGSYWALQTWQRLWPNYGGDEAPAELYLSHWTGALPVLTITTDWAYKKFDHLFGTFTYDDQPVYGFLATKGGNPLDTFGRNLYLDTFDSAYGKGWHRENSFLTHTGSGAFCYGFFAHGAHPVGNGTKYRATIIGPGVTPLVMWEGAPAGSFDAARHLEFADQIRALNDSKCKPV